MSSEEQHRKSELDHLVDERFAEIFFLAKEEYDILSKSDEEQELYDMLDKFKKDLKQFCILRSLSNHWSE
jgi:hypothetical protein